MDIEIGCNGIDAFETLKGKGDLDKNSFGFSIGTRYVTWYHDPKTLKMKGELKMLLVLKFWFQQRYQRICYATWCHDL